jgi:predicted nucleotidyltransferase/DNA-binding XRE family transcriptional regulator
MTTAAEVIRTARRRAALTQSELARRTGIAQNVISDYERGKREPSFRAVDLIVHASDLALEYVPYTTLRRLRDHREQVLEALAAHGARNVSVFGSVAREDDDENSDLDLLVDFDEHVSMFDVLRMQSDVEGLIGLPVDLIPRHGLKPEIAATVHRDAVPL